MRYGQPGASSGYGQQPFQGQQGGYGYPTPGSVYGPPGGAGSRPRRRTGLWLGVGGGCVAAAVAAVLIFVFVVHGTSSGKNWTLTAPATAGGLSRNNTPGISSSLGSAMGGVRSQFNQMPNVGQIKSTVEGVYNLGHASAGAIPHLVVFVGLNGTFNDQAVLNGMVAGGDNLPKVSPGPHGGTAECGTGGSGNEVCFWVTSTTIGFIVVEPNGAEAANALDGLMIHMRTDLEQPAS